MKTHKLKIENNWLERIKSGEKTAEIRYNDRDYQAGDVIQFMSIYEHDVACSTMNFAVIGDKNYLIEQTQYRITHVLPGDNYGLESGYVMLSIHPVTEADSLEQNK